MAQDTIMGLYIIHNVWRYEHISLVKNILSYVCIFIDYVNCDFALNRAIFLKNLDNMTFEA